MTTGPLMLFGLMSTWATPMWLMSVGVALGLAVLAVLWCLVRLVSRSTAAAAVDDAKSGVLLPILALGAVMTVFAGLAILTVPNLPYRSLLNTVRRISSVGETVYEVNVPASTREFQLDDFKKIRLAELRSFSVESDQPLTLNTNIPSAIGQLLTVKTQPGERVPWERTLSLENDPLSKAPGNTEWTVTNVTDQPARLRIVATTQIEFPEVWIVPKAALATVLLILACLLVRPLAPKVSAIAATTAKESMLQPLFLLVLAAGGVALVMFVVIPYNTFGDDVKIFKQSGLELIMVLALIVAVWSASASVSEEVEGRTALTVLSKPVTRRQFLLGKFLGIIGPVLVLFVLLGAFLLLAVSYKVVYDAREVSKLEPTWQMSYAETIGTLPGLVLAFFEAVVLSAISVALSTRLPTLANLIVCTSIYVLGNLVPMVVQSSAGERPLVRFFGQLLATILPVLENFNIQAAVAAGAEVPLSYLGMAALYCALLSAVAMLLGLILFEDRDLA